MLKGWVVRVRSAKSNTKGWQARIPFGKVIAQTKSRRFRSRLFSDAVHGGSIKAKQAALRWLKKAAAGPVPKRRR
jgi:hypothetical protein